VLEPANIYWLGLGLVCWNQLIYMARFRFGLLEPANIYGSVNKVINNLMWLWSGSHVDPQEASGAVRAAADARDGARGSCGRGAAGRNPPHLHSYSRSTTTSKVWSGRCGHPSKRLHMLSQSVESPHALNFQLFFHLQHSSAPHLACVSSTATAALSCVG